MMMFPKPTKVRSNALKESAKGQKCTIRLPGVCCRDEATVVLCHLPGSGKGISTKENDIHAAFGCVTCHAVIDGRDRKSGLSDAIILDACLRALSETQAIWYTCGLLTVKK